jgi:hypothetical protein
MIKRHMQPAGLPKQTKSLERQVREALEPVWSEIYAGKDPYDTLRRIEQRVARALEAIKCSIEEPGGCDECRNNALAALRGEQDGT